MNGNSAQGSPRRRLQHPRNVQQRDRFDDTQQRLERARIVKKLEELFESQISRSNSRNKKRKETRAGIINGLRFMSKLGEGSYGAVWKAQNAETGELVAVKKLLNASIKAQIDFLKEAEILRVSNHPNVLRFLGVFVNRGDISEDIEHPKSYSPSTMRDQWGLYLCTEYCDNGDLATFLRNEDIKVLPWETRMKFALDVAMGVDYLHSHKIVHRDMKSENVLLRSQKSGIEVAREDSVPKHTGNNALDPESLFESTAILADVGLARWFDARGGKRPVTIRGNPWTMAPELFSNEATEYSTKCDIFSLGMVFLEIATRLSAEKLPRRKANLSVDTHLISLLPVNPDFSLSGIDNIRMHGQDLFSSKSSIGMCCPNDFLDLALWCADADPESRPESSQVVETLKGILRNYKQGSQSSFENV
eukprot:CAMPEP_0184018322 /NCGR_PEP_ID=MMETSP0954-20121128/8081_1 /TAXON_ID=627963 /ORGANISM="Aplanochytrium sp, Strain PBS07" /LENGTH=418 /DNA_ID=CAMNT_0026299763 /DNA_START=175 /DNA_END=1431 /DNA_ORIENTATION=+